MQLRYLVVQIVAGRIGVHLFPRRPMQQYKYKMMHSELIEFNQQFGDKDPENEAGTTKRDSDVGDTRQATDSDERKLIACDI